MILGKTEFDIASETLTPKGAPATQTAQAAGEPFPSMATPAVVARSFQHSGEPPLICLRGLTKLYRMGDSVVRALDGVDLDIHRGEFVAITGASGSGKSTMMHVLGCLDRPTAGRYILNGREVGSMSEKELAEIRNKKIGFVFQTFNLINRTSAQDNVSVPLFYARQRSIGPPARRALERVGLAHRYSHRPSELSGGERQRVAIARAIVNDPLLLMADEPTGNLDSRTGEQIMSIFHDLNAQGVTIVLVTHELDVAVQARRIVHMKDGRILSDRPVTQVERDRARQLFESQQAANATMRADGATMPTLADSPRLSNGHPSASESTRVSAGAEQDPATKTKRAVPGATTTLVLAILSAVLLAAAYGGARLAPQKKLQLGNLPSGEVVAATAAVTLTILTAVTLAVVTAFRARSALRRSREEPGMWTGAGRVRAARIISTLVILAPLIISVVRRML